MLCYYETLLWDLWMFFAETQGMGWGFGIITASIVSRAIFAPIMIYSVSVVGELVTLECVCAATNGLKNEAAPARIR